MKTKKTVTPFNMQEIARALREMISEDSPNASEALLSGTREAVFREIFIFHYPSFLEKLYQSIPEVDKDEELICMLVALGQSVKEIAELIYFSPERVEFVMCFGLPQAECDGSSKNGDTNEEVVIIKIRTLAAKIR